MKRMTPSFAAILAAMMTVPLAAIGADAAGILDQATAWIAVTVAAAATSAIAATVTRVVGVTLDARARETIQTALERAAALSLEWVMDRAAETPMGQRITVAARQMLPYLDAGAADSLRRFGLDASGDGGQHLQDMAKAELIRQLTAVAPDRLVSAIEGAGLAVPRR